jgi:transcription antitermination factor NusG
MKKEQVKEIDFEKRVCEVLVKRLGGKIPVLLKF